MKNLDLMTLQRSFALSALLLVSACGDPGAELGELETEQQAVWVNIGGQ